MIYFDSAALYVDSKTTMRGKIAAIDEIQAALLTTALKAATTGNMSEYSLNDGQTSIRTTYKSAGEVMKSYRDLEVIKQELINQINGRTVRLIDGKIFVNRRYGR